MLSRAVLFCTLLFFATAAPAPVGLGPVQEASGSCDVESDEVYNAYTENALDELYASEGILIENFDVFFSYENYLAYVRGRLTLGSLWEGGGLNIENFPDELDPDELITAEHNQIFALIGYDHCIDSGVAEESAASVARESSNYFSQTVANRIRTLLTSSSEAGLKTSFKSRKAFDSGINAGENTPLSGLDNISFDASYSRTNATGRFNIDSVYGLIMTDKVVGPQRLVGFGLGVERSRERQVLSRSSVRSEGVTLTGYAAQILNEHFTFVPQAAFTYLFRDADQGDDSNAWRAFASLGMLGQRRLEQFDLSGFGQLVYTYEDPNGSADRLYVGQVALNGEVSFMREKTTRPFLNAFADYEWTRSASSGERFSHGVSAGFRSTLESGSLVTVSASHAWRGSHERTQSLNAFMKFFF